MKLGSRELLRSLVIQIWTQRSEIPNSGSNMAYMERRIPESVVILPQRFGWLYNFSHLPEAVGWAPDWFVKSPEPVRCSPERPADEPLRRSPDSSWHVTRILPVLIPIAGVTLTLETRECTSIYKTISAVMSIDFTTRNPTFRYPKFTGTRTPSGSLISSGIRMPSATWTPPRTGMSSDIWTPSATRMSLGIRITSGIRMNWHPYY